MKITIDIDCTPEEARNFLGLPDFSSVNEVMVAALKERTIENIDSLSDPTKFWERAMTAGNQSFDLMQTVMGQVMKASGKD